MDFCQECQKCTETVEDWNTGKFICTECGLVSGQIYDERHARRNFEDGPDHRHAEVMFPNSVTIIGNGKGRLNAIQKRLKGVSQDTFEKNVQSGKILIKEHCYILNFSKRIQNEANHIFETFMEKTKMTKKEKIGEQKLEQIGGFCGQLGYRKRIVTFGKKSMGPLTTACIFIAAQKNFSSKNIRQISGLLGISSQRVSQFVRKITKECDVNTNCGSNAIGDQIVSMISTLRLGMEVEKKARKIGFILGDELEGKRTATLAATSVYLGCQELGKYVILENLAVLGNCAESTIENTVKLIRKKKIDLQN